MYSKRNIKSKIFIWFYNNRYNSTALQCKQLMNQNAFHEVRNKTYGKFVSSCSRAFAKSANKQTKGRLRFHYDNNNKYENDN